MPTSIVKFDQIISTLRDGNERERGVLMAQVKNLPIEDRSILSSMLREEIERSYSGKYQLPISEAARNPELINTIRSWMLSAIIWADAETDVNKNFILHHLDHDNEPNQIVRYWVLTSLYDVKVSYLNQAINIALHDTSDVNSCLARTMRDPNDSEVIVRLREDLSSTKTSENYRALRALRTVAVPSLAEQLYLFVVTRPLGNLTYDGFHALANPPMARMLKFEAHLDLFIRNMLAICKRSEPATLERFIAIFYFTEKDLVRPILRKFLEDNDIGGQAREALSLLGKFTNEADEVSKSASGYASDTINVGQDFLNIERDLRTLTSLIFDKNVVPPLAIGLFGDWGSGKSFFMESLKFRVSSFGQSFYEKPNPNFNASIVQIEFNAWHYVDTNLWASLVSTIFEKLSSYIAPVSSFEDEQRAVTSKISRLEQELIEQQKLEQKLTMDILSARERLDGLALLRRNRQVAISELTGSDLSNILGKAERDELFERLNEIGFVSIVESINDLDKVLEYASHLRGRFSAVVLSIYNSKHRNAVTIALILIFAILPLSGWLASHYFSWSRITAVLTTFLVPMSAAVTSFSIALRTGLAKVDKALTAIDVSRGKIQKALEQKISNETAEEISAKEEVANLQSSLTKSMEKRKEIVEGMADANQQLDRLCNENSLNYFLSERNKSDDYRKHTGLISQIRKDFNTLYERLNRPLLPTDKSVDRIVLYIDDLDRCPPDKVMEVLQAIHLILAYPMFIVVVGVDPRWLLSSINIGLPGIQQLLPNKNGAGASGSYLEKIFQIPFCLPAMTVEGYSMLVRNLLAPVSEYSFNATPSKKIQKTELEELDAVPEIVDPTKNARDHTSQRISVPGESVGHLDEDDENLPHKEPLVINTWEADFAGKLFMLSSTPRSAKRFTNIYRIIKASRSRNELSNFEGSKEAPGEFRAAMILLSIAVCQRDEVAQIFEHLNSQAKQGIGLPEAASTNGNEKIPTRILDILVSILEENDLTIDAPQVLKWLPIVSRFSFELAHFFRVDG